MNEPMMAARVTLSSRVIISLVDICSTVAILQKLS